VRDEELVQENPMTGDIADVAVESERLPESLNVHDENQIPQKFVVEDVPLQMVQQDTFHTNSDTPDVDVDAVQTEVEVTDGVWQVAERQADDFVGEAEVYAQLPENFEIIVDDALAPSADLQQQHLVEVEGSELCWAIARDRHPLVSDEEASYIMDLLASIRDSVMSNGFGQVALAEGLCTTIEAANAHDPNEVVRIVLERLLQTYSRNGASEIFVMQGTVYSTGYNKKLPLHVFPGDAMVSLSEQELQAKAATMTVVWPWDVRLEPDAQYS
jgi:hypothetical protein